MEKVSAKKAHTHTHCLMVGNKFTTEWNEIRYIVVIVGGSGNRINTEEIKNNNVAQVIKKAKQQILDA